MYRAEVIGSMLRPSYLKQARAAFEQGELPVRDFKRVEDRAVDQVIAMQEGTGVDVVTDGEMRRFLFMGPITETVEGIELVEHDSAMPWSTPEGDVEWTSPAAVTSKLRKVRSMVTEEYSYARARARLPLKVTVPSPLVLYGFWSPRHSTAAYERRVRDVRRRRRGRALGDPGARLAGLRVHPGRRARARHARRPARARLGRGARVRRRAHADRGHRPHQRDGGRDLRRAPGHPPVPRQQRGDVDGQRRLRLHRPGAVRARDGLRCLLPRVRRRPLGVVRAARRRARRQAGRARARLDQDARARDAAGARARASTRPRASWTAIGSGCPRNAASPRSRRATRSPRRTRSPSCGSWRTPPTPPGARS